MKLAIALLALLALVPAACNLPPTPRDRLDPTRALAEGDYRMSMNLVAAAPVASDFRLGNTKDDWDSGGRYELDFLFHFPATEYVEPMGGGFLYYEEHDYRDGASSIDYDVYGAGIELGALFTPMKAPDRDSIVVGVMPYTRIGAGYQDGVFRDIAVSEGTSTGEIDDWRLSVGIGVDARVSFFQRLLAAVGIGFEYWDSARPTGTTRDASGVIVEEDDRLRLRGTDWWVRASIGFKF